MLLNELFALALIPTLIKMENGTSSSSTNRTEQIFEDLFQSSEQTSESDGISISNQPKRPLSRDPLLAEIMAEEQRLNLAFPDDYFDHLQDKSEEVRELIRSRKHAIESQVYSSKPNDHEEFLRSRSDIDEASTQFPILTPADDEIPTETTTPTTTILPPASSTNKPKPGGGVLTATFDTVHQGTHSLIDTISRPFIGARNLFGRKQTTSTTTKAPFIQTQPKQIIAESVTTLTPSLPLNCTQTQTEYNGQCYNVLNQGPCEEGKWLIEDPTTNKGKCVENKCAAQKDFALYGGECIHVSTDKPCDVGMRTYIYKSGIVECDCKVGHLYNEKDGNCVPAYRQGKCPTAQYFAIPKKSGESMSKPVCMPNPCLKDGYFCNAPRCPRQRNCAELDSSCGSNGQFKIHPLTNTPYCLESTQALPEKIIGNVPTLSCAPGTRRDILGNCRTPTNVTFS